MKYNADRNKVFSRSVAAFLMVLATSLAQSTANATPHAYHRVEASDRCRDIKEVRVRAGWWIDSIQLVCHDGAQPRRGGAGGALHTFRLRPGEHITGISGRRRGPAGNFVYALQIHTNLRSSPVFGESGRHRGSRAFHFDVPNGHFLTGIETRSGRYLEKIALKTRKLPFHATGNGVIAHHCRNVAEVRVRQTPWGSEIEVICARGRVARRATNSDWTSFYRSGAPSHYDERYVRRNSAR